MEENGGGDDVGHTMINLNTGQALNQIGGLGEKDASELINEAVQVIQKATQKCQDKEQKRKVQSWKMG